VRWVKFIPSHVSFISKSNIGNCIKIRWFWTKLQTKISWFHAHARCISLSKIFHHLNWVNYHLARENYRAAQKNIAIIRTKLSLIIAGKFITYTVGHKKEPTYFFSNFVKNQWILMQFSLLDSQMNDTCAWHYELHPPHLISVTALHCESQNTENVIL